MSIKKFKSFEEAHKDLWVLKPDDEYYMRLREFFELVYYLNPTKVKKKIFKFRSIRDAKEIRDK